jgi:hypothetical protein
VNKKYGNGDKYKGEMVNDKKEGKVVINQTSGNILLISTYIKFVC